MPSRTTRKATQTSIKRRSTISGHRHSPCSICHYISGYAAILEQTKNTLKRNNAFNASMPKLAQYGFHPPWLPPPQPPFLLPPHPRLLPPALFPPPALPPPALPAPP